MSLRTKLICDLVLMMLQCIALWLDSYTSLKVYKLIYSCHVRGGQEETSGSVDKIKYSIMEKQSNNPNNKQEDEQKLLKKLRTVALHIRFIEQTSY